MIDLSRFHSRPDTNDCRPDEAVCFAAQHERFDESDAERTQARECCRDNQTQNKIPTSVRAVIIAFIVCLGQITVPAAAVSPNVACWAELHREQPVVDEYPEECDSEPKSGAVYANPLPLVSLQPLAVTPEENMISIHFQSVGSDLTEIIIVNGRTHNLLITLVEGDDNNNGRRRYEHSKHPYR